MPGPVSDSWQGHKATGCREQLRCTPHPRATQHWATSKHHQTTGPSVPLLALDQLPMGSRLTPRLMSAPASSRRRVLSVLVRSVTGRGT